MTDLVTDAEWQAIDYKTRLKATAYVFQSLLDHAHHPGSFRVLIYDRLGFSEDAYPRLMLAGGLELSNLLFAYAQKGEGT